MIKFYIPDGHLEKRTLDIFARAGFQVTLTERGYNPEIDDEEIVLKRIRDHRIFRSSFHLERGIWQLPDRTY